MGSNWLLRYTVLLKHKTYLQMKEWKNILGWCISTFSTSSPWYLAHKQYKALSAKLKDNMTRLWWHFPGMYTVQLPATYGSGTFWTRDTCFHILKYFFTYWIYSQFFWWLAYFCPASTAVLSTEKCLPWKKKTQKRHIVIYRSDFNLLKQMPTSKCLQNS